MAFMSYPIKGFLETSFSDWPGRVVSVLFLPSCNFRCPFCHNHGLVLQPEKFDSFPWEVILERLQRRRGWIDGVCLTGGEPTLHPWLPRLIRELRSNRKLTPAGGPLGVKLDTNGTRPEILAELRSARLIDYVAMDLKAPLRPDRYSALTGVPCGEEQVGRIQASIQILLEGKMDYEFRTTVVPALLEEEEVYALARSIRGARRYTLQSFNPREALDEGLRKAAPTDPATLQRMQERVNGIIGKEVSGFGFQVSGSADGAPRFRLPVPGVAG
jgi:pyruvate formate lyase activating enzyme